MATRGRIDDLGAGSSITHARHKKGLDATKRKLKLGNIIGTKYWELKIVKNDLKAKTKRLSRKSRWTVLGHKEKKILMRTHGSQITKS